MRILLIEDNEVIANNIKNYLALERMQVDIAYDGVTWLQQAKAKKYDVILLDIMLPKMDGIAVCTAIRKSSEVPIIMLTAKGQIEDKAEGFGCGADDYLVKPFDLEELLLRIKAQMKRNNQFEHFVFWDIEVSLESRTVLKKGKPVNLTIKEFYILELLIKNYWFAVSRADIVEYVRGNEALYEENNKLDVYIANLRKKLDKKLITTLKWFGYKISKE
jgi:DNA-binding response OmpR family regulator